MAGPLAGVKVIDLTAVLLGPFATQHLADMGADVIKIEPPEGDLLRLSGGSMGRDKSMGPIYMAANRNKRSLCLDLKKPAAVEVLKDLIKDADLFIHNSRPAAIERLGLGYADLKKINPSIVYAYSLGYARRCMDLMLKQANERKTFGALLAERQQVQWWLADSWQEMEMVRWITWRLACKMDKGGSDWRREAAMVKLQGSEMIARVSDRAIQLLGGMGVSKDLPLEYIARACRVFRIFEGPSEVHRWFIARDLLRNGMPSE